MQLDSERCVAALRSYIAQNKSSQADLAAVLGVHPGVVSKWMNGQCMSPRNQAKVYAILGDDYFLDLGAAAGDDDIRWLVANYRRIGPVSRDLLQATVAAIKALHP